MKKYYFLSLKKIGFLLFVGMALLLNNAIAQTIIGGGTGGSATSIDPIVLISESTGFTITEVNYANNTITFNIPFYEYLGDGNDVYHMSEMKLQYAKDGGGWDNLLRFRAPLHDGTGSSPQYSNSPNRGVFVYDYWYGAANSTQWYTNSNSAGNNRIRNDNTQRYWYAPVTYPYSSRKVYYVNATWHFASTTAMINTLTNKNLNFRVSGTICRSKANGSASTEDNTEDIIWTVDNTNPSVILAGDPQTTPVITSHTINANGTIDVFFNVPNYDPIKEEGISHSGVYYLSSDNTNSHFPSHNSSPAPFVPKPLEGSGIGTRNDTFLLNKNIATNIALLNTGDIFYGTAWRNDPYIPHTYRGTNHSGYKGLFKKGSAYTIPPFPSPKTLTVVPTTNGQLEIKWTIDAGTSASPTDDFILRCSKDNGVTWVNLGNEPYNYAQTTYTKIINYPHVDEGDVDYIFQVKRDRFNWNVTPAVTEKSVTIATNSSAITTVTANANSNGTATINWSKSAGAIGDSWYYQVTAELEGVTRRVGAEYINMRSDTLSVIDANPVACKRTLYTVSAYKRASGSTVNGTLYQSKTIEEGVVVSPINLGDIDKLSVSKGFYNDRVSINWTVSSGASFQRYSVVRRIRNNANAADQELAQVNHTGNSYTYEDNSCIPGVYYDYTVFGWIECDGVLTRATSKTSIGFSQPYGVVSGRVAYEGSNPVRGVTIIAEGEDDYANKSMKFTPGEVENSVISGRVHITTPYKEGTLSPNGFTFQAWIKHNKKNLEEDQSFMTAVGRYNIYMSNSDGKIHFQYYHNDNTRAYCRTAIVFNHSIPCDDYTHVTITHKADQGGVETKLYLNGKHKQTITANAPTGGVGFSTLANLGNEFSTLNQQIHFGRGGNRSSADRLFEGYMDELRLWNRALSKDEIEQNFDRYITGKENGLKLYYRFDEQGGEDFFDVSCQNNVFNENHGVAAGGGTASRSTDDVPSRNQLAIKAITDSNGYYLLNTIPYLGAGSTYTITPILGVHSFNPSNRPFFFSQNSSTHNNADFTDVSSFKLTGTVTYDGGNFPVEGCSFEIDGRVVVGTNGSPVISNPDGTYSIDVPIGKHEVRIKKTGHTFVNDGKAVDVSDDTVQNIIFNSNLTYNFFDLTRVKLIGHIVGGKIEHEKPSGFGERINNIGAKTLDLVTVRTGYKLSNSEINTFFVHGNSNWTKPGRVTDDTTRMTVMNNTITITVSPVTGEFVAYVYPEAYIIQNIFVHDDMTPIYTKKEQLDLTGVAVDDVTHLPKSENVWIDSVFVPAQGNQLAHYLKTEKTDTNFFNAEWGFYLQNKPTFTVQQKVGDQLVNYFGDLQSIIEDPLTGVTDTVPLVDPASASNYIFSKPVFQQGKTYTFFMKAFEQYHNRISDVIYTLPVSGGSVQQTNSISLITQENMTLNDDGEGTYTFVAGTPDLTTGIKTCETIVKIDDRFYFGTYHGANSMEAYLLGHKSTGTDFLTAGPDEVAAIVFDPPGSTSYAYLEAGTTISKVRGKTRNDATETSLSTSVDLGAKVTSFVGVGAGVIMETDIEAEASVGFSTEVEYESGETITETTTINERIETSSDPMYVGSMGDIYIGNSTNILYGLTNSISLLPRDSDPSKLLNTPSGGNYAIGRSQGMAFGPTFNTRFVYTEYQLENVMIPKWQLALKNILKDVNTVVDTNVIEHPVYVSKLLSNDPNFGKKNTDPAFGTNASKADKFDDGPSYKVYYPANYFNDRRVYTDSVIYYNQQIERWKKQLARSEEEKVNMRNVNNYSFGGGARLEYSRQNSMSVEVTESYTFVISPSVGFKTGGTVCGIGLSVEGELNYTYTDGESSGTTEENTTTTGFVLSETGSEDQITVDYGISNFGTYAFRTRGGRTSCPYEGERRTRYYEPGVHVLNEATMQIEVPVLSVQGNNTAIQVPANRPAVFVLELKNESETNSDGWFTILIDDSSNLHGAEVRIDGAVIGNGRNILVRAGEVQEKTLTISKGPNEDRYENIKILLVSQCQYAPTDPQEDIIAFVTVSVDFIPTCTDVSLRYPEDQWVINTSTGDSMLVLIDGYDVNYANFSYITLQYRPSSSSSWNTLMNFYTDSVKFRAATGLKTFLPSSSNDIRYVWNMKNLPDGAYELRSFSVCGSGANIIEGSVLNTSTGIKDMTRPMALGYPSPANGILNNGDELSILFNENIQTGLVTRNNFTIKGVLNERTIANPTVGLAFAQTGSAETELPIYTDGSFTIEGWFRRDANKGGTIFSYGSNSNYISAGFNTAGKIFVSIGGETKFTNLTDANAASGEWEYLSVSYDRATQKVTAYLFKSSSQKILFDGESFNGTVETQGRFYVGAKHDYSDGFTGALSNIHFWKGVRTMGAITADMNITKIGNERNLIGYWELAEGHGEMALDKARSRHLILNTDWYIYPGGKAAQFNGTSTASFAGGHIPFREYDNFTVEFWFNPANQANMTLFSAGHGINDYGTPAKSLSIIIDNNKELALRANGQTYVISSQINFNQWNHLAISVKRNGVTNAYLNGVSAAQIASSAIGGMETGFFHIGGCSYRNQSYAVVTNEYFTGAIDEIRIWKSALTKEGIELNMRNKLRGTESGLAAYFPFETYTTQSSGLITVTACQNNLVDTVPAHTLFTISDNAPALMDCRPVENVAFTHVTSDNKIVFNITENIKRIEGVILEISADEIYDLRGNQSVPERWTAFVNLNTLKWSEEEVEMVIEQYESKSFTVQVSNNGGETESFSIDDIPTWLSASQTSGSLTPLSAKTITFTVAPGVNIGAYEATIMLTGTKGIREPLAISLKVTGERPDWNLNPHDFEQTMNVTGQIRIESIIQEDPDDILAAFIGDTCVGLASPIYIPEVNAYLTFMDIYGNGAHFGRTISFKLWDASTGRIYPVVEYGDPVTNLTFQGFVMAGTPITPIPHNARNIVEQSIVLQQGRTWMSVNVENSDLLNQFKTTIGTNGIQLKGQTLFIQNPGWAGNLLSLENEDMYIAYLSSKQTMVFQGQPLDVLQTPITLNNGWNWIGYTPNFNTPLREALAGINASPGDLIKGQVGYSTYVANLGWIGSLSYMYPGKGYMYYNSNGNQISFTYPNSSSFQTRNIENENGAVTFWNVNPYQFENNMTVTAIVFSEGEEMISDQLEIAAFCGAECRGTARLQYYSDFDHSTICFLMVYGNQNDQIEFKIYDHRSGKIHSVSNENMLFSINGITGNPAEPYILNMTGEVSIDEFAIDNLKVYPNPAKEVVVIAYSNEIQKIELFDAQGRVLKTIETPSTEIRMSIDELSGGIYFVKIYTNDSCITRKFVKE